MASIKTNPLPTPSQFVYEVENEQTFRRTLEVYLENLQNDVLVAKAQSDKPSSLAMRRFQFLLMGAS